VRYATRLVEGIAAHDRDAIAACFAPDARFRALIPPGPLERVGSAAAAETIAGWFADSDPLNLVESETSTVGDRLHLWYRFVGTEDGRDFVVEQQLYATDTGAGLSEVTLLCSGFRSRSSDRKPAVEEQP
jgi:SnoaL-like domain